MPKQLYSASEAARALGVSLDTLRRWDRAGRIRTRRDSANRRLVLASEIERLRGEDGGHGLSARNRLRGVVQAVKVEGLLAQVEIEVTEPARIVAVVTRARSGQRWLGHTTPGVVAPLHNHRGRSRREISAGGCAETAASNMPAASGSE